MNILFQVLISFHKSALKRMEFEACFKLLVLLKCNGGILCLCVQFRPLGGSQV